LQQRWPKIKPLTKRDAAAPGLGDVLTLASPRTDDPLYTDDALRKIMPPSSGGIVVPNASLPSKLQKMQASRVASLPVRNEQGTYDHEQPDLKTAADASDYIRDRTAAWEQNTARRRRSAGLDKEPANLPARSTRKQPRAASHRRSATRRGRSRPHR
jgi:phospholipase C